MYISSHAYYITYISNTASIRSFFRSPPRIRRMRGKKQDASI